MGAKLDNWERLLAEYVERLRFVPFEWGKMDCVTFAAGAVESVYGVDPLVAYRGKYDDEKSARRLMYREGGFSAMALSCGYFKEIAPAFVSRGDLVVVTDERGRDAFRVCLGNEFAQPGESGLLFTSSNDIKLAITLCLNSSQ